MTTSRSPLHRLKYQADKIAHALKSAERREAGKIAAARERESVKFAIAMDDKIVTVEMPWTMIRETSEAGISEWIVQHMRDKKEPIQ